MRFYCLDDDKNICNILKLIIQDRKLGTVCGSSTDGQSALEDLPILRPDIVIVDLLMPEMDGITFVRRARTLLKDTAYIMLSQVSSKEMIASAYEAGIEFYIQKPLNSIEVEKVILQVCESISLKRAMAQMQNILNLAPVNQEHFSDPNQRGSSASARSEDECPGTLRTILQRLGIIGDIGSRDIIMIVNYLVKNPNQIDDITLNELCSKFSDSPKSMEQRIRRTASTGMVNLAHLGIEDYSNEIFTEYSNTLYNFEQVRKEMDYIRGKSKKHGNVKIKNFLNALAVYCMDN
ncbi:MAG: response regulator [Dorea sp.]|uniref:response regulator n=1 Tax=Dorea sp. YH-dor226 TaxID=3151119 RepID=UPI00303C1E74|nr:response regulator [Dorea sp.]